MESGKPSRSDDLLSPEEQSRLAALVREHFDSSAPRRAPKPARSEGGSDQPWSCDGGPVISPEEQRLRQLLAASERLPNGMGVLSSDDYAENEYYKGLNSVGCDSQHYTTGNGFIAIEKNGGTSPEVLDAHRVVVNRSRPCYKSNPATNDWEPSPGMVFTKSLKPSRSDP
ncbi:uncharacterized protein LOC112348008 [Selaginella moellendorffii]|uniref:uncharacterized protein LOC112348008 n=1 Tax=Selaginella moellendorffii TaxID=88036 RepID=UPI000D1C6DF9|nr:uncharacterized protein LOC112348008 [Selaginella moellendorffii]|eukprot:XP_024535627.1 uncharacterized protein LOC112348008 [Selaginella moellendorffii]